MIKVIKQPLKGLHMCQMQPWCVSRALQKSDPQISLQKKVCSTENKVEEGRRERWSEQNYKWPHCWAKVHWGRGKGAKFQLGMNVPKTQMNWCKHGTLLYLSLCRYCRQNFRVWGLYYPWLSWVVGSQRVDAIHFVPFHSRRIGHQFFSLYNGLACISAEMKPNSFT